MKFREARRRVLECLKEKTLVHEFLPVDGGTRWYIKVFVDDERDVATFMSVHPSGE